MARLGSDSGQEMERSLCRHTGSGRCTGAVGGAILSIIVIFILSLVFSGSSSYRRFLHVSSICAETRLHNPTTGNLIRFMEYLHLSLFLCVNIRSKEI